MEYNQWKLSILVKFAEASLDVIYDVDSNFVSPEVAVHLTSMREQFLTTRALCSEDASPAETAAARARTVHVPLFSSAIPASGVPQSPVGSPLTSSHVPSTPPRHTSRKGKTGPEQHICHICDSLEFLAALLGPLPVDFAIFLLNKKISYSCSIIEAMSCLVACTNLNVLYGFQTAFPISLRFTPGSPAALKGAKM